MEWGLQALEWSRHVLYVVNNSSYSTTISTRTQTIAAAVAAANTTTTTARWRSYVRSQIIPLVHPLQWMKRKYTA